MGISFRDKHETSYTVCKISASNSRYRQSGQPVAKPTSRSWKMATHVGSIGARTQNLHCVRPSTYRRMRGYSQFQVFHARSGEIQHRCGMTPSDTRSVVVGQLTTNQDRASNVANSVFALLGRTVRFRKCDRR
ncbi:hypothetical protein PV04_06399 [Phialophora macrospora]|uniref:Uncharacterized protein n=1 Tax=Phialophora macrospora TaxID=1851006 RepID=A0A0D2DYB4_9EURO|nr:hypothetical protein PV04_06399 [Phialophora macrospora]